MGKIKSSRSGYFLPWQLFCRYYKLFVRKTRHFLSGRLSLDAVMYAFLAKLPVFVVSSCLCHFPLHPFSSYLVAQLKEKV